MLHSWFNIIALVKTFQDVDCDQHKVDTNRAQNSKVHYQCKTCHKRGSLMTDHNWRQLKREIRSITLSQLPIEDRRLESNLTLL